jgi:hypothetical protein
VTATTWTVIEWVLFLVVAGGVIAWIARASVRGEKGGER